MSPSVYTLKPWLLLFNDCGLGSDPNATGPCNGTYGPGQGYDKLSQPVTSELLGGKNEILAIGAALLGLLALIALMRLIRRAATDKSPKQDAEPAEKCAWCNAIDPEWYGPEGQQLCGDCYAMSGLQPGEGYCTACGLTYTRDPDDDDYSHSGCPVCGGHGDLSDESAAAADVEQAGEACAICGEPVADGEGRDSMFGVVHASCEDETEARARIAEIDADDDGPDGDNPRGVGAGDKGLRA